MSDQSQHSSVVKGTPTTVIKQCLQCCELFYCSTPHSPALCQQCWDGHIQAIRNDSEIVLSELI